MPAPDYSVEIEKLRAAMSEGTAEIRLPDGTTRVLRSVSEIKQAITHFQQAAAGAAISAGAPNRTSFASFERR